MSNANPHEILAFNIARQIEDKQIVCVQFSSSFLVKPLS